MNAPILSYSFTLRAFHWGVALLIFLALGIGVVAVELPRGPLRGDLLTVHKSIGVTVLALVGVRIVVRLLARAPDYVPPLGAVIRVAARAMHLALYALMIALPVSGYLHTEAGKRGFAWFGLVPFPNFVAPSQVIDRSAGFAHYAFAWLVAAGLVAHLAATAWHVWVRRDGVLNRMWPGASAAGR